MFAVVNCSMAPVGFMKAFSVLLGLAGTIASFHANVALGFSISAVTVSPSNVVSAGVEVQLVVDIVTPGQGTWLYAPSRVSANAGVIRVDIYPASGMLAAIGALRETVTLGVLPAGTHQYEVAIHPNVTVNWGTRTNRGNFVVTDGPPLPLVGIHASQFRTAEPCPVCLVAPGVFTISRTGSTATPLTVHLQYDGSAAPGQDYNALPPQVTIPAGTNAAHFLVLPNDDLLVEGPEIVRATIVRPETATGAYGFSEHSRAAMVVIGDDEPGAPDLRLDIAQPKEAAQFAAAVTIEISVLAVWTQGEVDRPVQFFAGDRLIAQSSPPAFGRPPIPGLPSVHTIFWTNPPAGAHALTARYERSPGLFVASPPVNITIGGTAPPVVSIHATQPIAEESSYPYRRLPFRGEFTIVRSGSTADPLNVFVHYSGTAAPGADYPAQPFLASIPAGAESTRIAVTPVDDGISEGIETVVAALSHCPPDSNPPMGIPCYGGFDINHSRARATVFIRDNGITEASITITNPADGATFAAGETVNIDAVAIDLNGYMGHVEFWDGPTLLGSSDIAFFRAPDPGTPIYHNFEWRGASAGDHVLTARSITHEGQPVSSQPVRITVTDSNPLPVVTVTAPDCFAVEPDSSAALNTATFRIVRSGPLSNSLVVAYSLDGAAENGGDYEWLSGLATIPAGASSVDVVVRPIADKALERLESVILQIDEPAPPGPLVRVINPYRVGRPSRAAAVISDGPWLFASTSTPCVPLGEGLRHICFAGESGGTYHLEGSADLRTWQALATARCEDGALHFVDIDAGSHACRFYRLRPE